MVMLETSEYSQNNPEQLVFLLKATLQIVECLVPTDTRKDELQSWSKGLWLSKENQIIFLLLLLLLSTKILSNNTLRLP